MDTQALDFNDPDEALRFVRGIDYPYPVSGIFPSEMAFFLWRCERAGVECIIESGRYFGYSTAILAAYGELRGIRVVSIDVDSVPEATAASRRGLGRFQRLELITGDSFCALPRVLRTERRRIALLVDGPKSHAAVYLSAAACAIGTVCLVAHHNVEDGHADLLAHFGRRFPGAGRLESSELSRARGFSAFRVWERELTRETHRDLDRSTLLVSALPKSGPELSYLEGLTSQQTWTATCLFWWWKTGPLGCSLFGLAWRGAVATRSRARAGVRKVVRRFLRRR
jgi:predicted O-methyltransferase YrrM